MSTPVIVTALDRLVAELSAITVANGYNTDVRGVYRNRAADLLPRPLEGPTLCLHSETDEIQDMNTHGAACLRTCLLQCLVATSALYGDVLDGLLHDVRSVLRKRLEYAEYTVALGSGAVSFQRPEESPDYAGFTVPISITYLVSWE